MTKPNTFEHLIKRSGAAQNDLTLLTGNGFSNRLGLSFSSSAINTAAEIPQGVFRH